MPNFIDPQKAAASTGEVMENRLTQLYNSPSWLLVIIAVIVFTFEFIVMVFLSYLPGISARTAVLLDSTLLILLILPCLHFLVFRPLVLHIKERRKTEVELRGSLERLRNLSAHLRSVREEERTAIAREIHDELGQALATLLLDVLLVEEGLHDDQLLLSEKVISMAQLVEDVIKTVHRISCDLRPTMLDDLGLAEAMEWRAKDFERRTGIPCEIAISIDTKLVAREVSTAIYRIFQETLTNVLRHSKATRVEASLVEKNRSVQLVIRDNGRGMTREQINNPLSIGLAGMRERAELLGGRARIFGSSSKGTMVAVKIPLVSREENHAGYDEDTDCR